MLTVFLDKSDMHISFFHVHIYNLWPGKMKTEK